MVFRSVLSEIHERVEGTLGVGLIGLDGIAIDKVADPGIPMDSLGAEFGAFIKSLRLSNTELNTGEVQQFSLVTERFTTFLSAVTTDYFILMVISPDGNYGRARYEMMKAKYRLQDELS